MENPAAQGTRNSILKAAKEESLDNRVNKALNFLKRER
jgi:hypothetical protein